MMTSKMLGIPTSKTEISNISKHGIWLISEDKEYFMYFNRDDRTILLEEFAIQEGIEDPVA
ncbi:MAG: hypothetical protein ACO3EZ_19260 [Prochlorotrichaceae cyanobacterium]